MENLYSLDGPIYTFINGNTLGDIFTARDVSNIINLPITRVASILQYFHSRKALTRISIGRYCKFDESREMKDNKSHDISAAVQAIVDNSETGITAREIYEILKSKTIANCYTIQRRLEYLHSKKESITRLSPGKYCKLNPELESSEMELSISESIILETKNLGGKISIDNLYLKLGLTEDQINSAVNYLCMRGDLKRIGPGIYSIDEKKILENMNKVSDKQTIIFNFIKGQEILVRPVEINNALGINYPTVMDTLWQLKKKERITNPHNGFYGIPGRIYELPIVTLELHRKVLELFDDFTVVTAKILTDKMHMQKQKAQSILGVMSDQKLISRIRWGHYIKYDESVVYKTTEDVIREILKDNINGSDINFISETLNNKYGIVLAYQSLKNKLGTMHSTIDKIGKCFFIKHVDTVRKSAPAVTSYEKTMSNTSFDRNEFTLTSYEKTMSNTSLDKYKQNIDVLSEVKIVLIKSIEEIKTKIKVATEYKDLITKQQIIFDQLF